MIRVILNWDQTQVHPTLTSVLYRLFCFMCLFVCYSLLTPLFIMELHQGRYLTLLHFVSISCNKAANRMSLI